MTVGKTRLRTQVQCINYHYHSHLYSACLQGAFTRLAWKIPYQRKEKARVLDGSPIWQPCDREKKEGVSGLWQERNCCGSLPRWASHSTTEVVKMVTRIKNYDPCLWPRLYHFIIHKIEKAYLFIWAVLHKFSQNVSTWQSCDLNIMH